MSIEYGVLQDLALEGVTLLKNKESITAAESVMAAFERARDVLQKVIEGYREAITSHAKGQEYEGMTGDDWEEHIALGDDAQIREWLSALAVLVCSTHHSPSPSPTHPPHPFACVENIFCVVEMVDLAVCKIAQSDHCNGAQKAIREVKRLAKQGERLAEVKRQAWWGELAPEEVERVEAAYSSEMFEVGCQHHLRNIGCGNGEKAMDAILLPRLKEDIEKIKAKGIQCVTGEYAMTLRSSEKYFGNTSKLDAFSAGPELQAHTAKQSQFHGVPYKARGRVGIRYCHWLALLV